jgi:hypothetical protein
VWNVTLLSLRQAIVPDRLMGRVVGAIRLIGFGSIPVGALLGGLVARALGLRAPFLLGAAVLVLAALLVTERANVPHLLVGALAGITTVSAYSLGEYVVARPPLDPFEGELLHRPLGYANALGIYAAIGALLAVGLGLRAERWPGRAAALAPLAVLLPTLYLTSSRGAWLAFAAGLVVLLRFGRPPPLRVVAAVGVLAVAAVAAVLVVSGGPGPLARLAGENRADYWRVAWEEYREDPLLGGGAGTFGDHYLARGTQGFTRTAHSLYVQSLAELGPVGLLLVLAALALPLARLRARGDPLVAAAAAAYVSYVLHTGVDWDWELPATTFAGLLSGAALLAATRREPGTDLLSWKRAALGVALLVVAAGAAVRIATGPALPFGP